MATRRDFVAVAAIVAKVQDAQTRATLAEELADYFVTQNHRFDRLRFYRACSVSEAFMRYRFRD